MECFSKNSNWILVVNYFRKKAPSFINVQLGSKGRQMLSVNVQFLETLNFALKSSNGVNIYNQGDIYFLCIVSMWLLPIFSLGNVL